MEMLLLVIPVQVLMVGSNWSMLRKGFQYVARSQLCYYVLEIRASGLEGAVRLCSRSIPPSLQRSPHSLLTQVSGNRTVSVKMSTSFSPLLKIVKISVFVNANILFFLPLLCGIVTVVTIIHLPTSASIAISLLFGCYMGM